MKLNNIENMPKIIKEKLNVYNEFRNGDGDVKDNENENQKNKKETKIESNQTESDVPNKIGIIKRKNWNQLNEPNTEKNKKNNTVTNDHDNNENQNKKNDNNENNDEEDSNRLKSTNKADVFLIKVNNIDNKKDEDMGSKDALIKDENNDNKNTNIIK